MSVCYKSFEHGALPVEFFDQLRLPGIYTGLQSLHLLYHLLHEQLLSTESLVCPLFSIRDLGLHLHLYLIQPQLHTAHCYSQLLSGLCVAICSSFPERPTPC